MEMKISLKRRMKTDLIFIERVNIEEIYRQLKELYEIKADKKDLDELNDKTKSGRKRKKNSRNERKIKREIGRES